MYNTEMRISKSTIINHDDALQTLLNLARHMNTFGVYEKGRYIISPSWFIELAFKIECPYWIKPSPLQNKVNTGMYAGEMCGFEIYRRLPDIEPIEDALLVFGY